MLIKIERVIIGISCCNEIVSNVISKICRNNLNRFNDTIHKNHKTTSTFMIKKIEVTTSHVARATAGRPPWESASQQWDFESSLWLLSALDTRG